MELFAVEHRYFIVLLLSSDFYEVHKCDILKGGNVLWCEDTPGDRGLCTGIVGWHKG